MGRALGELLVELCEEELLVELCGALGGVLVEHLEAPNTFLEGIGMDSLPYSLKESAEPFEEAKTEEPSTDEFEVLKKAKGEMPSNQDKPRGRRASWCRCRWPVSYVWGCWIVACSCKWAVCGSQFRAEERNGRCQQNNEQGSEACIA